MQLEPELQRKLRANLVGAVREGRYKQEAWWSGCKDVRTLGHHRDRPVAQVGQHGHEPCLQAVDRFRREVLQPMPGYADRKYEWDGRRALAPPSTRDKAWFRRADPDPPCAQVLPPFGTTGS